MSNYEFNRIKDIIAAKYLECENEKMSATTLERIARTIVTDRHKPPTPPFGTEVTAVGKRDEPSEPPARPGVLKHGPGGRGGPGPCDKDCVKCVVDRAETPIPMLLWCPQCGGRHVDVGEFAVKVHHTHACQHCGCVWRPAIVNTTGVQFLPGFKDG